MGDDICTYYQGSNLTFTVTSPGTFVVSASVTLKQYHTTGYNGWEVVALTNASAAGCSLAGDLAEYVYVETQEPTGFYGEDVSLVQDFTVGQPGTYTFGLIGEDLGGASTDYCYFYFAGVVAVFYPS